ncbi:MAG: AI-2E family transporter [Patescibacteria group bacterium]
MVERKEPARLPQTITISTGTIIRSILILLVLGFLYLIRDVLAMFLAALFLAALIDPFADYLERMKIPRGLAALIVYIIGLLLVTGALILILPPVLAELTNFSSFFEPILPEAVNGHVSYAEIFSVEALTANAQQIFETIRGAGISAAVPELLEVGSNAFGAAAAVVVVLILAFFLVAEKTALVKAIAFVAPAEYQPFVMQVSGKMRERLGSWLRGQLLLMLAIFILTYIALTILGVPYAIILALMAGLLEIIPFIGPWLAAVPAVILALSVSPVHALLTGIVYLVIQMIENNILVPKIMQKVSGLNPIISLLAVLIGWRVGNVVGVILSIPLAMAASVFLAEIFKNRHEPEL